MLNDLSRLFSRIIKFFFLSREICPGGRHAVSILASLFNALLRTNLMLLDKFGLVPLPRHSHQH